jgi:hypothetical protein
MTKSLTSLVTIFGLLVLMTSCDRPACENTNSIFAKFAPDTKEYKDELIKQFANVDKSQLSYWMDTYQEDNDSPRILVNIQGSGLCAKILLAVKDSDKGIEGLLAKKGVGYRGAELKDLTFDIQQDSVSTEFIFKEISGIVD